MTGEPVLVLDAVSKSFPAVPGGPSVPGGERVDVLREVDLVLGAGEKASLMGPSGAGKSTVLSLMAGLLRPDAGRVVVDGVPVNGLPDRERARLRAERIGIALQSDNLVPFLSARENVELALGLAGRIRRRRARSYALELLDRFAVGHRAEHRPRHLSGGEAQRVALAVALANDPALLLADEAVAQLDAETAGRVLDDVLSDACAVLYVTHDPVLADRTAVRYQLIDRRIERR
jgi:putative ABC transport system ATP-binding protein